LFALRSDLKRGSSANNAQMGSSQILPKLIGLSHLVATTTLLRSYELTQMETPDRMNFELRFGRPWMLFRV
jgi:hypothetical protein